MDFLKKGYKILQDLDEPQEQDPHESTATSQRTTLKESHDSQDRGPYENTLEASLEGAAGRLISWAGSAAQQLPGLSDPARQGSSGPLHGSATPPLEVASVPKAACQGELPVYHEAKVEQAVTLTSPRVQCHYIGDDDEDSIMQGEKEGGDTPQPEMGEGIISKQEATLKEETLSAESAKMAQEPANEQYDLELANVRQELQMQVDENEQSLRELQKARQEISDLRAQLQDSQDLLHQREQQLTQLSEVLAEKEATCEEAVHRARQADQLSKQDARDTQRELLQAQERWQEKIAAAERRTQDAQREAHSKVSEANAERDEARAEARRLEAKLASATVAKEKARKELESNRAQLEAESKQLVERLRASADMEMQLRREITCLEQGQAQFEERCADLTGQLERAQAAYDVGMSEVGAMSMRLHELEFGAKADTGSEDMLRQQLSVAKDRCGELEQRLNECTWMRDYALQQAEAARSQLHAQREEMAQLANPAGTAVGDGDAHKVAQATEELKKLKAEMERMAAQHQQELKRQVLTSREEVEYLKRKSDEKDRRLEVLICERNALRFESVENQGRKPVAGRGPQGGSHEALPDLEYGEQGCKPRLAAQGAAAGMLHAIAADADTALRRLSRLLYVSPTTRRIYYGYFILLHVWIWVVLHHTAAVHSPHGA